MVGLRTSTLFLAACCLMASACSGTNDPPKKSDPGSRIPATLDRCWGAAKGKAWASDLREIPSTVVDKGPLRDIPYSSFRSGNYEVNVYGDPDRPCCIEVGIHKDLLGNEAAKRNCIEFIESLLDDPSDRALLRSLKLDQALEKRAGLTFEITPPTAEDAYGGWWVSVYEETSCEKARATPQELKSITVTKETILAQEATKPQNQTQKASDDSSWSPADLKLARTAPPQTNPGTAGRVYVRGYTRKDGAYVQPHTRSRPRR